jgi:four helix bundle protein
LCLKSVVFGVWCLELALPVELQNDRFSVKLVKTTSPMATVQRFEELEIWQLARKLSKKIYLLTFDDPIAKDYRFRDQVRGTSGSVMDNIAEGFGRGSKNEFIYSLGVAKGEVDELKSQCYRGLDVGYFSESLFTELCSEIDLLANKIGSFIKYLNRSTFKGQKFRNRNTAE